MSLALVWARSPQGAIGRDGTLPWRVPEDLRHFARLTTGHVVLMGRATWESLPAAFRPLPDRENVVLSRTPGYHAKGARVVGSLQEALDLVGDRTAWIAGGGALYAQALPLADRLEETVVDVTVDDADTWAPTLDPVRWVVTGRDPDDGWHISRTGLRYRFVSWRAEPSADPRDGARPGADGGRGRSGGDA